MGVLKFDNVDDNLKWTSLASALANVSDGAWTLAVLVKFVALGDFNSLCYLLSGAGDGTAEAGLSYNSSITAMYVDADGGKAFTSTISSTTSPYLFAVSKAAGSVTPRLGWKLGSGGSWTHEDSSSAMVDQIAATMIQIGTWQGANDPANAWIGLVGWWEGAMSDGNKEALDNGWRTSDWWTSAHGQPVFLTELNVDAGSVTDMAGNASSPSHTGTTLDAGETLDSWTFDGSGIGKITNISFKNFPKPKLVTAR